MFLNVTKQIKNMKLNDAYIRTSGERILIRNVIDSQLKIIVR